MIGSNLRFSILTKSYAGDLASFARLAASIDRHMPSVPHWVVVDRCDLALFDQFATPSRHIIDAQTLLPDFLPFRLGRRRLWWRRRQPTVVRGWIYQQLAKIALAKTLDDEAVVIIDSDAVFIAPLQRAHLITDTRINLYHAPGAGSQDSHAKWHSVASGALGLPDLGYSGADYISNAVVWSPDVVRAMVARIEAVRGKRWFDVLSRSFRFSEYILYGMFAEHVPGDHQLRLQPTEREICHCSWHYRLDDADDVDRFVDEIAPHHAAVLIQSNLGLSIEAENRIFDRFVSKDRTDRPVVGNAAA